MDIADRVRHGDRIDDCAAVMSRVDRDANVQASGDGIGKWE